MGERDIKYTVAAEDKFGRTFQNLRKDLGSVREHSDTALSAIGKLNTGLGLLAFGVAGATAGLVGGLRTIARDLDALNDASDATGASVEQLSALEDVARRNGAQLDLVAAAALKLNKALGENDPNSGVLQALKAIGLSAAELRKQSPTEALQTISLALQGYANDGNKARIIQELFGKSTKEVAGFLGDLAQAGKLNATVTSEQAAEAEKFNKALASLETNASNAGRAVANELIPPINKLFESVKNRGVGGSLMAWLGFDEKFFDTKARADLGKAMRSLAAERDVIQEQLRADYTNADTPKRRNRLAQIVEVELPYEIAAYKQAIGQLNAAQEKAQAPYSDARNAAGGKRVGDFKQGGSGQTAAMTEAQRYLEQLQKSGEKLQELTSYEQALKDVQLKRIQGITPALERQILAQAQQNDLTKQTKSLLDAEVDSRSRAAKQMLDGLDAMVKESAELEKEVATIGLTKAAITDLELARIDSTIALKEATIAEKEAKGVGEERLQVLNAEIDALRKRRGLLVDKTRKEADEEVRKSIDDMGERTRDTLGTSLEQGILDGVRRGEPLYKVFLRELEAQFAKTILTPIIRPIAETGNKLLEQLLSGAADALFGGGMKIDYGGYGIGNGTPTPTHGGLANGGRAKAGGVYRVNENGIETFQPDQNGTVLSASQSRRQAQAQPPIQITQVYHVNGDVSPQTIQAMQAMIARNNQQLLRSARTGGAFAT